MDKLFIKRADVKDTDLITTLGVTTFTDAFGPVNTQEDMDKYINEAMSREKLSAELNDPRNLFFLIETQSMGIAYAKMRDTELPEEIKDKKAIEIERLYVLKSFQNKRIGDLLINHCITYAVENCFDIIWLGVWEHNTNAIRFYERLGFTVFGSHDFVLGTDVQT